MWVCRLRVRWTLWRSASLTDWWGIDSGAAGWRLRLPGRRLRFASDTAIALTGADFGARLDGVPRGPLGGDPGEGGRGAVDWVLRRARGPRVSRDRGRDCDVPEYLGSRSTFILGGSAGMRDGCCGRGMCCTLEGPQPGRRRRKRLPHQAPDYSNEWEIGVLYGPHGAPDFFTPEDIEMFFSTDWKVHYNSDRTGVRLIGPKPHWARRMAARPVCILRTFTTTRTPSGRWISRATCR